MHLNLISCPKYILYDCIRDANTTSNAPNFNSKANAPQILEVDKSVQQWL